MTTATDPADTTPERLLEAATRLFAERGYDGVSVRELAEAAGANVAAVSYHFAGKEGLYRAALLSAHGAVTERLRLALDLDLPAEERLRRYVATVIERICHAAGARHQPPAPPLDHPGHAPVRSAGDEAATPPGPRPCAWPGRHGGSPSDAAGLCLVSREMAEPTPALDDLVAQGIRPVFTLLVATCAELMPAGHTRRQAELAAASVVGQCLHWHHARAVIDRLFPGAPQEPGPLAAHIAGLSLAGLRHYPVGAPASAAT